MDKTPACFYFFLTWNLPLETIHTSKDDGADISCITERVSVKMIAKDAEGTVLKKLFKPIEDAFLEETRRTKKTELKLSRKAKERR